MNGILIVNKPKDWTSFDVVAKVRNLTKVKKVGHSGTLDPMATGVLPVFLGEATKSIKYFLNGDKGYLGEMTLGVTTDTGDASGKRISEYQNIRTRGSEKQNIRKTDIESIFRRFTGEIEQVPPMYSAVKINGKKLYELARMGITIKREPRKVKIYKLEIIEVGRRVVGVEAGIDAGSQKMEVSLAQLPTSSSNFQAGIPPQNPITFYVECSKGTYIRQLVVDMGEELGCGAHLSRLERVYSHPFHISQALPLETIINMAKIGRLESVIIPVEAFSTKWRRGTPTLRRGG